MAYELWQNTTQLCAYNDSTKAFNALLELTSLQFTGSEKPRVPTGGFTWADGCTTDGTVRLRFDDMGYDEFYYVIHNETVYTTDGYDVVLGDLRKEEPCEVVYPPVSVERAKKLKELVMVLHSKHEVAATEWIQGWREAQSELPLESRVDVCPFMKTVEVLPTVRTCLGLVAHLNQMKKDLKWISENPPGLPEPEAPVKKAQRWQLRAPGFYKKIVQG